MLGGWLAAWPASRVAWQVSVGVRFAAQDMYMNGNLLNIGIAAMDQVCLYILYLLSFVRLSQFSYLVSSLQCQVFYIPSFLVLSLVYDSRTKSKALVYYAVKSLHHKIRVLARSVVYTHILSITIRSIEALLTLTDFSQA